MKILHILDHYIPHVSGYVFRTSYILKYQKVLGLEPVIVTSPKQGTAKDPVEDLDKISVYRTPGDGFGDIPFIREVRLMKALQQRIEKNIKEKRPDIIHAHSPSLNGIPALRAGRKFGIPVVYEVRAFWEDAAVDHGTFSRRSLRYKMSRVIETSVLRKADALFTICEGLRKEMISRGIPADKITVIPNCVDADFSSYGAYDTEIADNLTLRNKKVFGFIGSFYKYEGVDLLIGSFADVIGHMQDARLLLVGDGEEKERLFRKTMSMGLGGKVIFTGKVPHEKIRRYYSVMDVLVYPRRRMRLTELVTPLKPLEAMAMGKLVIGSDVGGIRELITSGKDGFLFRAEDSNDLSRLMLQVAADKESLQDISSAAVETIQTRHKWESAVKRYLPVYERLLK
jgi:glycogen(starch) synthase